MRIRISQTLCVLALSVVAFGQGNSDNVRGLNNRVLQFHSAMQSANAVQTAQIRAQAGPVIAERAAAMVALIRQDPNAALGLAFSQELRDDLAARFPAVANSLEQHGTWTGASDHLIFDDPARQVRRYQVSINAGSSTIEVYSAGEEPHCVSGDSLAATGIRVNNVVAAGSTSVTAAAAASLTCSTLGPQNSAVLLVDFPGISLPSNVTPTSVNDIFFANSGKSVNMYWKEASYQQASATGQVFGPFTLDRVYSCDEYNLMRTAAIAAADATVNFTQFTRVFIVFPNPGSCAWAGLGTLGCGTLSSADGNFQASTSWLLATYMGGVDNGVKLATHEGGHNLTLHHSSSRSYGTEALGAVGAAGTLSEYGDPFSTMGSWNFGHYPAQHKVQMGWLPSSNVTTVQTTGSFTILPFENNVLGVQALKVLRGTGGNSWLWLEYRQPVGLYDSTLNPQIYGGAVIHQQDSTTGTHTHLLDFTPGSTSGFSDAALAGSWTDPYTNLSLAVTGANASGLSVNVGFGALTCDSRVQPTVVISPNNPSVMAGTSYNFSVSVTNQDPLGCGNSAFNLSSLLPSGWTTTFSSPSLTVAPGQTLSATMNKAVPAGFTPGTYAINAVASDANHSTTAANNITVIASTCSNVAPTVTLSPSSVSLLRGATQNFTLSVRNNDASPCASRTFSLASLLPSGWSSSLSANSLTLAVGATGTATLSKTVPAGAASGNTSVSASASDSFHSNSATATINVIDPAAISLATSAISVSARSNVTLTATVTSGGSPAAGAAVVFSITRNGAGTTTKSVTANAAGIATLVYKAQQKGTYTAVSTATVNGASATSNTVTFAAN